MKLFQSTYFSATQFWRKKIAAVANKYPDITFAIADDETNAKMLETAGLGDSGEELNVLLLGADDEKFPMEPMEEYDSDDFKEFLDKYKKGAKLSNVMRDYEMKTVNQICVQKLCS